MSITQENAIRAVLAEYADVNRTIWKAIARCSFENTSILAHALVHIERRYAQEIDLLYRQYDYPNPNQAEECVDCGSWSITGDCPCVQEAKEQESV